MQGEQISYDGDALADFTMIRFLDRFVYRNPKKTSAKRTYVTENIVTMRPDMLWTVCE